LVEFRSPSVGGWASGTAAGDEKNVDKSTLPGWWMFFWKLFWRMDGSFLLDMESMLNSSVPLG
jgi:hypothetical protein